MSNGDLGCCLFSGGGSVVVDLLFIVDSLFVFIWLWSLVFFAVLSVFSSFEIIWLRMREKESYLFNFNPFKPNGISHSYYSNPFLFKGVLGGIFHFCSNFKRNLCKQRVVSLIRRCILRRLIWFCTVC